ncbi:MAG: SpoIIE family protein phosphatase [Bacteroidales bacterium]|nr:SpoIIE family protein phosphatase [Bacteroidales bacterium]
MKHDIPLFRRSIWSGILLVMVAAITLEATSLIQYFYSHKEIRSGASSRAESQLEITRSQITDVLNQAEAAVRNSMWIAQWCIDSRDSLPRITYRVVDDNPVVVGSCIAFVPGYYEDIPLLAPYTFRDRNSGELRTISLATPEYDYPSQEWFSKALGCDSGYWSEPYVDEGGGDMLMTTFSMPIKDMSGRVAAILTADISLVWLTAMFGDVKVYPNAFTLMSSQTGKIMVSPIQSMIMEDNIQDVIASMEGDTAAFKAIGRDLLSGTTGNKRVTFKGATDYIYYAPVERTGWMMSIVIPEDEIFGDMKKVSMRVWLLQLLGLLMLFLILRFVARNRVKYQALTEKKDRMENELKIASNIQKAMIPKSNNPFPDRKDIDLAAVLLPAREVGGDLYDFFIQKEKLFFCIGDVSGKGVPASLVMAVTRSLFRTVSSHQDSPGKIVKIMNDSMTEMNENNMFVTFFCGILDLETGHMRYCNAGHNSPVLMTNVKENLDVVPNLPLGVMPGMVFQEQEMDMCYDDSIFLYTDGLTEAENRSFHLFGENRMLSVLTTRRSAQGHLEAMEKSVEDFVGDAPKSDDLTMLFIHFMNESIRNDGRHHLVFRNDIREVSRLVGFVEEVLAGKEHDPGVEAGINLALEEIMTNVIMYAYPEGTDGLGTLDAVAGEDSVEFTVTDDGMAFDPTAAPDVDITLNAEERNIGGLGIHMVRNIMDSLSYRRENGKNILTMIKKL